MSAPTTATDAVAAALLRLDQRRRTCAFAAQVYAFASHHGLNREQTLALLADELATRLDTLVAAEMDRCMREPQTFFIRPEDRSE